MDEAFHAVIHEFAERAQHHFLLRQKIMQEMRSNHVTFLTKTSAFQGGEKIARIETSFVPQTPSQKRLHSVAAWQKSFRRCIYQTSLLLPKGLSFIFEHVERIHGRRWRDREEKRRTLDATASRLGWRGVRLPHWYDERRHLNGSCCFDECYGSHKACLRPSNGAMDSLCCNSNHN